DRKLGFARLAARAAVLRVRLGVNAGAPAAGRRSCRALRSTLPTVLGVRLPVHTIAAAERELGIRADASAALAALAIAAGPSAASAVVRVVLDVDATPIAGDLPRRADTAP